MTSAEPSLDLTPVEPPALGRRSRRRSFGVLAVLALAVLALVSQGLVHSLNYFMTVDQALASRAAVGTHDIRLEGVVVPNSIVRTAQGASFVVRGSSTQRVAVHVVGTPPQLFGANIPVVVVGHFTTKRSTVFDGTQILVKHTASYIARHPSRVTAPNGSSR